MKKEFNDTGLCIPQKHYMVNTAPKLEKAFQLIEKGKYFIINRPRQFGKTTTLALLSEQLNARDDYIVLDTTFEGIDTETHQNQELFIYEFLMILLESFEFLDLPKQAELIAQHSKQINNLPALSRFISKLIKSIRPEKAVVLLIDEVDKSANNQLFLDFLAMLRSKYLRRDRGLDLTFQSVILAGLHDIKTLKTKIRPNDQRKYNSPWNIAVDFNVDLSFSAPEIETMLHQYSQANNIKPNIPAIAKRLYYYTSGYPYLVSKLCKFIDEQIITDRSDKNWSVADVEAAFKLITKPSYHTTLFDSLIAKLENNTELYDTVFQIIINGELLNFAIDDPMINLASLYGILSETQQGHCQIHNRIFEQRIYTYMMSKLLRTKYKNINDYPSPKFITDEGLDVKLIIQRFQTFMQENYSTKDAKFLERQGRLLFLAYLRPIINGKGFDFKEPNTSEERRMDLVITYQNKRYVIELKVWRGEKAHQEGLEQLSDYLDSYSLKEGYLLIYNFNKNKDYKQEALTFKDKHIFAVWV